MIPNADGGGQNNRHTTLLMTCAPQFRLCPRGNVGCGGKTRPDRPFYYELLRGNREHTLPYDRYLSRTRRAALFSSASETSFPFMVGEIRREQTRRGVCFFLTEGATYCTFTRIPHLYRTFRLSADSTRRCCDVFDFCVGVTHVKESHHVAHVFTLIWRQTTERERVHRVKGVFYTPNVSSRGRVLRSL